MNKYVTVPYVKPDGIPTFRNSELAEMYNRADREGWLNQMFHDGTVKNEIDFVKHVTAPHVMFWGLFCEGELMGFFYVNRIERTCAHLHFAFFSKWWATPESLKGGRRVLETLLVDDVDGRPLFELLLGAYPSWNKHVLAYVHKFGAHTVTEVPHLMWSERKGKSVEGTIVSITREDLQ